MSKKNRQNKNIQEAGQPALLKAVKVFVYLALFTPLIVHTGFIFPFVFPKMLYFQVLIELAFICWVFLILKNERYRPRLNWVSKAILIFFLILLIASIFGVAPYKSFFSNYERSDGLFTLLHFLAFFFILTSCFKTKKEWIRLFNVALIASLIVSFYALFQKFGWTEIYQGGTTRLDATVGNPAYLAAYLIFGVFLSLYLWFKASNRWLKIYYGAAFIFQLLIIYFTATRGAILALGIGALCFLLLFLFFGKTSRPRTFLAPDAKASRFNKDSAKKVRGRPRLKFFGWLVLLLIVVVTLAIWLNRDKAWVRDSPTLNRMVTISFKEATTQTRLLAWRMSWQGFKEKPILGWGWENYNILFNKYFDPRLYPTEGWFDKAHNIIFDIATSGGILALIAYFLVFCACILRLWKSGEKDFATALTFSILLVVYFLQNLFVFDTPSAYLMVFVVLGFIAGEGVAPTQEKKNVWPVLNTFFFKALVILLVLAAFWYLSFKPASASKLAIKGAIYLKENKVSQALETLSKSYGRKTFGQAEIVRITGDTAVPIVKNQNIPQETKNSLRELVIQAGEDTLKNNLKDARYRIALANLITSLYIQDQPEKLNRAWEIMEEAVPLAPNHPLLHYQIAQLKIFAGDFQEAAAILERVVALNEEVMQSRMYLALAYLLAGEGEKGETEINFIKEKSGGRLGVEDYKKIAQVYWQLKDKEKTLEVLSEMERWVGDDLQGWFFLTQFYAQLKEREKTERAGNKVIELDKRYEQTIKKILESLEVETE